MKEKLELVTNFESLRSGMIVVVKPCSNPFCKKQHRHLLLKLSADTHFVGDGFDVVESAAPAWDVLPGRSCRPAAEAVVSADTVYRRIVYRVIDGLEQTTESRKSVTA